MAPGGWVGSWSYHHSIFQPELDVFSDPFLLQPPKTIKHVTCTRREPKNWISRSLWNFRIILQPNLKILSFFAKKDVLLSLIRAGEDVLQLLSEFARDGVTLGLRCQGCIDGNHRQLPIYKCCVLIGSIERKIGNPGLYLLQTQSSFFLFIWYVGSCWIYNDLYSWFDLTIHSWVAQHFEDSETLIMVHIPSYSQNGLKGCVGKTFTKMLRKERCPEVSGVQ